MEWKYNFKLYDKIIIDQVLIELIYKFTKHRNNEKLIFPQKPENAVNFILKMILKRKMFVNYFYSKFVGIFHVELMFVWANNKQQYSCETN